MSVILIIDDYPVTRRVLSHILERSGFEIITAENGLEALELINSPEQIDLIICDIAMPEMDGLTLLENLRSNPDHVQLPIIMLTASGQDEDRIRAESLGASGFLTKPASSTEILNAVGNFL